MIALWAFLGSLAAGWLLSESMRGNDLKALYFLAGMIGYPLICVGIGFVIGVNGMKIAAFGFLALVALALYVLLGPKQESQKPSDQ